LKIAPKGFLQGGNYLPDENISIQSRIFYLPGIEEPSGEHECLHTFRDLKRKERLHLRISSG